MSNDRGQEKVKSTTEMELKEFCRVFIAAFTLLCNVPTITGQEFKRFPLEGKQCTSRNDIPVIKVRSEGLYQVHHCATSSEFSNPSYLQVTSITTVTPLEDLTSNHVIFSSFSMSRRRLLKEPRPVRNITEEKTEICLGEGGDREWSIPVSNRSSYITEVIIECFDQGLGPVEFEYNGIGVILENPILPFFYL